MPTVLPRRSITLLPALSVTHKPHVAFVNPAPHIDPQRRTWVRKQNQQWFGNASFRCVHGCREVWGGAGRCGEVQGGVCGLCTPQRSCLCTVSSGLAMPASGVGAGVDARRRLQVQGADAAVGAAVGVGAGGCRGITALRLLACPHLFTPCSPCRDNQEAIVHSTLSGKDVFVLMPTVGGSKNGCFGLGAAKKV